jgi:IS5 family transposase
MDALFAVLCGCGHNIRTILRHLKAFLCQFVWLIALGKRFKQIVQDRRRMETAA